MKDFAKLGEWADDASLNYIVDQVTLEFGDQSEDTIQAEISSRVDDYRSTSTIGELASDVEDIELPSMKSPVPVDLIDLDNSLTMACGSLS